MSESASHPSRAPSPSPSRAMWEAVERYHATCYMAPEVREEGAAAGLKGFWMNYFATRIAPVGAVGPEIVRSTFFYYADSRIDRAIPDAWSYSTPAAVIAARYRGMDRALSRLLGDAKVGAEVAQAATIVRDACLGCDLIGRTIHAGWASLPWPKESHLALWHGCTLLREYRSGNHLIAVTAEGLDGCQAVVSHVAVDGAPRQWIRDEAGWTEQDEAAAVADLQARGWLDGDGLVAAEGRAGRARVETLTDELDDMVWHRLGEDRSRRLFDLLSGLAALLPPDDQLDWELYYRTN
ncbi:MAG: hypothetical protein GY745_09125 [Actinomycetia bacterium]|nr:hypothetical protein [Actinomycetes bacterium]